LELAMAHNLLEVCKVALDQQSEETIYENMKHELLNELSKHK
jgi:hypothetical protein